MSAAPCELIAITGGPGAGKTTVLNLIKKVLCKHVAILPEAASVLYGGGFWRLDSLSAKIAAQKAIYHVQREMENLVVGENQWSVALCDRGTLDGLAYWPQTEDQFWKTFNTTLEQEYTRYKAVIHLRSPDKETGYNYRNPLRLESPMEAAIIDEKIHQVWNKHPHYFVIESNESFLEKINQAIQRIDALLPGCCKKSIILPATITK